MRSVAVLLSNFTFMKKKMALVYRESCLAKMFSFLPGIYLFCYKGNVTAKRKISKNNFLKREREKNTCIRNKNKKKEKEKAMDLGKTSPGNINT